MGSGNEQTFKKPKFNSTDVLEPVASHFKHLPAAAVQVEAPIEKKGNDNRIIVAQIRGREPIIVCLKYFRQPPRSTTLSPDKPIVDGMGTGYHLSPQSNQAEG